MAYRYSKFGRNLPKQDVRLDINAALLSIEDAEGEYHTPTITPTFHNALPGTLPVPTAANSLIVLAFSLNNDAAWRQFKIDRNFASDPTVHIHWTKTGNANEVGKAVRWRVSYVVFQSTVSLEMDASVAPTVVEVEDTYKDSGTTTRPVHRTEDVPLTGFTSGWYVSMKVEAITPVGVALANPPGLFSLDIIFNQKLNS